MKNKQKNNSKLFKSVTITLSFMLIFTTFAFTGCGNGDSVIAGLYNADGELTYSWEELIDNNYITAVDGVITTSDDSQMNGRLVIPDTITGIGEMAFRWSDYLTSVVIPDSVTTIGDSAFAGCSKLADVVMGDAVITIGNSVFSNCDTLTNLKIGSSVTTIGDSCFRDCEQLTTVTIPSSVTSIGIRAFYDCPKLASVTFENTSGWYVTSTKGESSGSSLSADTLSIPNESARLLRGAYTANYWYRAEDTQA